jgi:transposase
MEKVLKRITVSSIIFSIKRLGVVTAAGIIGEVGNFGKFGTQSALLKHAGLNLYETSSGKHIGVRRITKRGRSLLRKLLYYASINLVRKGGIMHTYYERLVNTNGMMKKKALIAVSRKLLCLIYALVRDNSEYMEDYHGNKLPMKAA